MKTNTIAKCIAALAAVVPLVLGASWRNSEAEPQEVGIRQRVAWTSSRIVGSPDPPLPYVAEQVFPALKFDECVDITSAPGSDRLFVVEHGGKILSFPNRPDVRGADLVADLAKAIPGVKETYALAFHPEFEKNRYCYVCYIKAPDLEDGTHIARFRMIEADPTTIDLARETTIITWLSGGHNGCCLKFGPDGFLYISTGDGVGPNPPDTKQTGQDISDLLSSILRIDVDHADEGRNYGIPADNPFVNTEGARGEVWAYGLRNPWRMSFDRKTGDLWVGDVGWELWEMLDRIERGGNYGWAVLEGRQSTNPEWPRGPTPILPPTIDHPHSESSSITDGLTYYGKRLKELHGAHIYGDYDTGKFWGFRYENGRVVDHRELADTTLRIVGFGEDHDGEFYVLDHPAGTVHRLVPNPLQGHQDDFPRRLSETGLYASVTRGVPAPGVIPYSINAEPWEDYAVHQRYVAIPHELSIKAEGETWSFPKDSVLVKTLSLDMEHGNPSSRQFVETQILHFDGAEWQPYTYQWNDEQSDALLLDAAGAERTFEIVDPEAPAGKRKQTWRYSGRAECQRCHNKWSGPVLAFNTPQLNKVHDYTGVVASQLDTLAHVRLLDMVVPADRRPKLANPRDATTDWDGRARAYLHANCAHCHRMHAGSAVLSKMHFDLPLDKTDMVGVRPTQGTFGIHGAQVIAPGEPVRSVLLYRMSKLNGGRMPHIGSTEVDREGVRLVYEWLRRIPHEVAQGSNGNGEPGGLQSEADINLATLRASTDSIVQMDSIDRLLSSPSGALMLLLAVDEKSLPEPVAAMVIERATQHDDANVRDLFERFLPPDRRIKRLGGVVQAGQILSLSGDLERGREVFFRTPGVQCKNCHRIQIEGEEVGPDLTKIGAKYDRAQMLDSILEPSKLIDPQYVTYLVETKQGRLLTGLLVKRDSNEVVLKDIQNKVTSVPVQQVERLVPQRQSLMPELLLRDMTAQQVADLLEYLGSLK